MISKLHNLSKYVITSFYVISLLLLIGRQTEKVLVIISHNNMNE